MTGHLDGAHVGRVVPRPDVVVLHDSRRVEVVYEGFRLLPCLRRRLSDAVVNDWVTEVGIRVEPVVVKRVVELS